MNRKHGSKANAYFVEMIKQHIINNENVTNIAYTQNPGFLCKALEEKL